MRRAFMLVAFSLLLAGCSESNIQKAQKAAELVKQNCGIIVSIADIAAAFSAANPAITGIAAMANAICSQAERTENGSLQHYRGMIHPVQVEQPEPPPLPDPAPPMEETQPEPLPVPLPEDDTKKDDGCIAVVNGVCIRKEGDK